MDTAIFGVLAGMTMRSKKRSNMVREITLLFFFFF
jgi:hypothetical protein